MKTKVCLIDCYTIYLNNNMTFQLQCGHTCTCTWACRFQVYVVCKTPNNEGEGTYVHVLANRKTTQTNTYNTQTRYDI